MCFLPVWHRWCLEEGGEGVGLCSEACGTGRLEEKHVARSGPCPLCCALSSGAGRWQCHSPGAEGPASSTAKHRSCAPPSSFSLFLRHWKTHKCTFLLMCIRQEELFFPAVWEGLFLGSGHGEDPCPPSMFLCRSARRERGVMKLLFATPCPAAGGGGRNRGSVLLRAGWDAG